MGLIQYLTWRKINNGIINTCELFTMIKWEIFLQKEGDFRICNKQEEISYIKKREISIICEKNTLF
jgi:hypothetical protein